MLATDSPRSGRPLDSSLIALDSAEGSRLLEESDAKAPIIPLMMYFTTQENLGYCGVATATMVLNSLPIERPVSAAHEPFRLFTQENFFTPTVKQITSPDQVARSGMTLATLGKLLSAYPVNVKTVPARDSSIDAFKRDTVAVLKGTDTFVVVNYLRKAMKQETGGHISPIAAYNEHEDRFLILDVSRYKYVPVWVKSQDLWEAMATIDPESKTTRGYVFVSRR